MLGRSIGLISLTAVAALAMAGPQNYAQRVQNIRCGVVILATAIPPNATQPQSAGPYALYNLDSNTTVKPTGWNFYNPYAPTTVSDSIYARWSTIDTQNTPPVGTKISKRNAAYWEVFLSQVTDQVLANYDLLLVNPLSIASLNSTEVNRLRRFVDNGGILWIDPAGLGQGGLDQFNNFPMAFLPFSYNSVANPLTDLSNPLMNVIQPLTPNDINILDQASPTFYTINPVNFAADVQGTGAATLAQICGSDLIDFYNLQLISYLGSNPTIALGRIGDGIVVITSRGASVKLNRPAATGAYLTGNFGFFAQTPILGQDGISAAKLAVNMVGLLSTWRQPSGGSRKTSSSAMDLNPPLLSRSTIPNGGTSGGTGGGFGSSLATNTSTSQQSPTLYKGLLVTTDNGVVSVYDANPIVDLDGDGNTDDGVQDYSLGMPYDMIWQSQPLNGPLSSAVCTEVPNSNPSNPQDEVLVVDNLGNLVVFNLTPKNADGTLQGSLSYPYYKLIAPPSGTGISVDTGLTGVPLAPVVHEGIAYIASIYQKLGVNSTMLWQVDLASLNPVASKQQFVLGGNNSTVSLPEFSYSPTVGYIPIQDNSGGVDKVLYAPFAPNQNAGINAAGIFSIWLGAKGEVPVSYEPNGGLLQVFTRASNHGSLPVCLGSEGNIAADGLQPKITLLDQFGNPMSDSLLATVFSGAPTNGQNGEIDFPLSATGTSMFTGTPSTISGVRIDYTIDWGNANQSTLFSVERGRLLMPDIAQNPERVISGGVALSPQGTAYVVSSIEPGSPSAAPASPYGGGLYGFRELGVGVFTCVARYELYGPNTITLNQAGSASDGGVLFDQDGLIPYLQAQGLGGVANLLSQTMGQYSIRGGPTIRNGQVFVEASAIKSGGVSGAGTVPVPITILMAFVAEPQTPTFVIGDLPDGTQILQPDFARSTNPSIPENQSTLLASSNGGNGYVYDSTTGLISFPNLMSNSNGQIQNCMSLSQPIIVRKPGASDYVLYPDAIGGAVWNPLQWFTIINGSYPSGGAPLVTGNSLFASLNTFLPSVLNNNFSGVPSPTGAIYAVNAQIPAAQLKADTVKPWLNQLWTVDYANGTLQGFDPNFLWPQTSSVTSFADYVIKLNQTLLTGSNAVYGIVAGDNALVATGSNGAYTYAKSNFMICDEGRVIEMDPSGNPIWSTNNSASPGQSAINASGNIKPMVRPVRAYLLDQTDVLVADPGANRIAKLSTTGIETRSISSFILDPNIVPSGYQTGETLNLAGPRDALYYSSYALMSQVSNLVSIGDNENGNNYEYWQHYLIADTGNKRLVEVLDRFYYSPSTGLIGQPVLVNNVPQVGVLLWHSPPTASGKQYAYSNICRIKIPDANGGHFVYIAGIGGTLPTRVGTGLDAQTPNSIVDAQDGSGGFVVYDPSNPQLISTYNEITTPNVSGTAFWDQNTQVFDNTINQSTAQGMTQYVQRTGGLHRFTNLNSVTAKVVLGASNNPLVAIMIADGTGVYEVTIDPTQPPTTIPGVDWMMPNEVFRVIQQTGTPAVPAGQNAVDCRALYAKRLDSGEVMIVNGYYGSTRAGNPFTGEVLQVNGAIDGSVFNTTSTNLGFNSTSITLDLRTAGSTGLRGLVMPVFADRR